MFIEGASAAGVNDPPYGDFTALVEADLVEQGATNDVMLSVIGSTIDDNIQLYRTDTGYFVVSVNNSGNLFQAVGPLDPSARRMRAAVSCTSNQIRACFDGGEVLVLDAPRPTGLLRFWFGRLSLGIGEGFGGHIRTVMIRERTTDDAGLQAMTVAAIELPADALSDEGQVMLSHNQDPDAHDMSRANQLAAFNAAALGMTLAAADTFSGANGVITTSETGALTYAGLYDDNNNRAVRTGGVAGGNLKGGIVTTSSADGQVQANLVPNDDQAGLFVRYIDAYNYFLITRGINGSIYFLKWTANVTTAVQSARFIPFEVGEVMKARFVGSRIWVTRIGADGEEAVLFDVIDPAFKTSKRHGFRTIGTGTVDNLRIYAREPI